MQYLIRVNGHLDASWQDWFAPLQLTCESNGTTTLSGTLPDQAALYGVLLKLDRLGLVLLAVESSERVDGSDGSIDGAAETASK